MATSKKLTVIKTTPPPNNSVFNYWGNQSQIAQKQGWLPAESGNDYVRYKQAYNAPFNDVVIPNTKEKGSLQVIGKKGNKMDIVITDNTGAIRHVINRDVTPEFVQDYMSNANSTIAQRMNNIQNGQIVASR
jgi:hypothetical protein